MRWGEKPHHPAVVRHGVNFSDGFSLFHLVFLAPITCLVLFFEVYDEAEKWYKSLNGQYPADSPSVAALLSLSILCLLLHGIGAMVVWRRRGGYRKEFIVLASWEISMVTYLIGFAVLFNSLNVGVALVCVSWGMAFMTIVLYIKVEKWSIILSLPFLAWTTYLSYCGINLTRIE